jgi:hypothetical protein
MIQLCSPYANLRQAFLSVREGLGGRRRGQLIKAFTTGLLPAGKKFFNVFECQMACGVLAAP